MDKAPRPHEVTIAKHYGLAYGHSAQRYIVTHRSYAYSADWRDIISLAADLDSDRFTHRDALFALWAMRRTLVPYFPDTSDAPAPTDNAPSIFQTIRAALTR